MRATYRVSWVKPKEYRFMISALEICLGVTLASRDTDPKLLCSSGHKDSCIVFQVFLLLMVLVVL